MRPSRIFVDFIHYVVSPLLAGVLFASSVAVAQNHKNPAEDYNAFRTAALNDEARGDYKSAIGDLTQAIAAAHSWAESADAYKFRADVERRIGDVNGAMQDEANADYVAMDLDANPALPNRSPAACPETADAAKTDAPYRAYSGCALPQTQTATLRLIGLRARSVDGRPFFNTPPHGKSGKVAYIENSTMLALTPGHHSVLFIFPATVCSLNDIHMDMGLCPKDEGVLYSDLNVEAGKAYTAAPAGLSIGDWTPIIEATEKPMPSSPSPTSDLRIWRDWPQAAPHHVEIDEQQPYSKTYLQLYEAAMQAGSPDVALTALRVSLALFPNDANRARVENLANKLVGSLQKAQIDAINAGAGFVGQPTIEHKTETPNLTPCTPVHTIDAQMTATEAASPEIVNAPDVHEAENLKAVLLRAQDYVEVYVAKIGNLIGREIYVQDAVWTSPFPKKQRQRTEADYGLRQVGNTWVAVRDVDCVDGKAVKNRRQDFRKILETAADGDVADVVNRIANESAAYNIGDFSRTFNQPNFALEVLYRREADRFEFQKAGETEIGGVPVWVVNFKEVDGPTLVHYSGDGKPQFSNGTLWIERDTGRVRKTEMMVPHSDFPVFRSRAVVSYQTNARLAMLVPATMDEHYDSDYGQVLDCHAEYFDFQRPEIQTHLDFGAPASPPKTPGPPPTREERK